MYIKREKTNPQNIHKIARNVQDLYAFFGKLRLIYINKNNTIIYYGQLAPVEAKYRQLRSII